MPVLTDPQRLELLKLLHEQPQMSQRDLAQAMDRAKADPQQASRLLDLKRYLAWK